MTADEVENTSTKWLFGAEEFLDKYKDSAKDSGIGHFGLVSILLLW
jgi:molecular chaperone HtpG